MKTYTIGFQEIHYNYITVEASTEAEAVALALTAYETGCHDGYLEFSRSTDITKVECLGEVDE